jgi:hypothetical protein
MNGEICSMSSPQPEKATKVHWGKLGAEAFLIVFSVLLALAVDEWRQDRADRQLVARIQETIHDELVRNRAIIVGRLPYHEMMSYSTQRFVQQNLLSGKGDLLGERRPEMKELGFDTSRGLATAGTLGRTGWELALNSGALEHMDYKTMVALSQAYAKQEQVERETQDLLEQMHSLLIAYFGQGKVGGELMSFASALTDMVLREREVLTEYDRALAMTRE